MIFNYYLGIGSNIEPRLIYLKKAIFELEIFGKIIKKSCIYESDAWGHKKQSEFLNAVLHFQSKSKPIELLHEIKNIETKIGRLKSGINWGPREIDIDIIFADGIQIRENDLEIPHKYFHERKFVLMPMAELNPEYIVEGNNFNIEYYLNECKDNSKVNKLKTVW